MLGPEEKYKLDSFGGFKADACQDDASGFALFHSTKHSRLRSAQVAQLPWPCIVQGTCIIPESRQRVVFKT